MNDRRVGKFIALILRHKPEVIGISLDENGWADVDELIEGISRSQPFTMADLERIVREDAKQRYAFNEDKSRIRASQGHSLKVDVGLKEMTPPDILYHGSSEKSKEAIDKEGLKPMSRLYVHLSIDYETAVKVGSRHGKPVIYEIDCKRMVNHGYVFYQSENRIWLTKKVPKEYLHRLS